MNKKNAATFLFYLLVSLVCFSTGYGQEPIGKEIYVDQKGIMRWEKDQSEVQGFGVNYSAPFAHAYRSGKKLGVDLKQAIEKDVYHFSRLGFDLYRIHIWDTEISDEQGNLLKNEHLDLFDYLIAQLKKRNINFVLTPIAYWGNGWPEPDEDTPGFSDKYGKEKSLTDSQALQAQQTYLADFLNHVNPYTGTAYKEEPGLLAIEISNEPHHRGSPEEVTAFINNLVAAIRSTGTEKPVFYNVSHSIHLAPAYAEADIQGGTFQWYPTGLGFGQELQGNLLPNVNQYDIPFDSLWRKHGLAKLVYEFDAADVMTSVMYPAMARSFREAGIQLATQFAYDPTYMAFANTEYNTHYMNLAYTPQKALGLMISGEIFHQVPLYAELGEYPENLQFQDFTIDYEKDLAMLNSDTKFYYTSSNLIEPKDLSQLKKVAGYGTSSIVTYQGKGAYFLDKVNQGVWRLEVMPDAVRIDNPFGKNSLQKTIAVIEHNSWPMQVSLPDLGESFSVQGVNPGNTYSGEASGTTFTVHPGTFILVAEGEDPPNMSELDRNFFAPESSVKGTHLVHHPVREISAGDSLRITSEIVSDQEITKVEAWLQNGNEYDHVELQPGKTFFYSGSVPENVLKAGFLQYRIIVYTSEGSVTFPGKHQGNPGQWDFYQDQKYQTKIVSKDFPLYLFNAATDTQEVVAPWMKSLHKVPANSPGLAVYQVNVDSLFTPDVENLNADPVYDYTFRYHFSDKIKGRAGELKEATQLVLSARSLNDKPTWLQVALVTENGKAFGKTLHLTPQMREYQIPLSDLRPVKTVTLPRPYPSFLPYYLEHDLKEPLSMAEAESLQFSIGPGIPENQRDELHGVGISWVRLE